MKNTTNPLAKTFSELLANKEITKESMHEAIELVAGKFVGFRSSAYCLDVSSSGYEGITLAAHYHGGKCYIGMANIEKDTPALEAISSALVKLNENIRLGFEAQAYPDLLECLEVKTHDGEVVTEAFLSENETADLKIPFVAA